MARRDTFIEKPRPPPEILRLGKTWQPPPDRPFMFPERNPHKVKNFFMWAPLSHSQTVCCEQEFVPVDDKSHLWEPYILEPEFKYEKKNFTPEPSPPPRRRGTGPLPQTRPQPNHAPNPAYRASVPEPLPPDVVGGDSLQLNCRPWTHIAGLVQDPGRRTWTSASASSPPTNSSTRLHKAAPCPR